MSLYVEHLENFPFKTFEEFKTVYAKGEISIGMDRSVAQKWAMNGLYTPNWLALQVNFFILLPFIAVLFFIAWAIFTTNWIMLLVLPVFIIGYFLAHPSWAQVSGRIKYIRYYFIIAFPIIGSIYSLGAHNYHLLAVCLTLIVIWYASYISHKKSVKSLRNAILEHEDLLCALWNNRVLCIEFPNGDQFWVDLPTTNNFYETSDSNPESDEFNIPDNFWEETDISAVKNWPEGTESARTAFAKLLIELSSIIVENPDDDDFLEMTKRIFGEDISDALGLTMKSFQLFIIDFTLNRLTDSKERSLICNCIIDALKNIDVKWRDLVNFMLLDVESIFTPCSEKIRILGDPREMGEVFAEGFLKRYEINL
jgi:hypothetical protein